MTGVETQNLSIQEERRLVCSWGITYLRSQILYVHAALRESNTKTMVAHTLCNKLYNEDSEHVVYNGSAVSSARIIPMLVCSQ